MNFRPEPLRNILYRFSVLLLVALLGACSAARRLPEGEYLLTQNVIKIKDAKVDRDDLLLLVKQKTNRKVLFLRLHLGIYNFGDRMKPGKFGNWLKRIGEEPVLLDTALAELTDRQFVLYMFRKGYFNASAGDSVVYQSKHKAKVIYEIHGNQPYSIRNLNFQSKDKEIDRILKVDSMNTLIKPGAIYDEDVIDDERSRITAELKNRGYFYFNRNYVNVYVDSALGSHQVDLYVTVDRINENVDSANTSIYKPEDHKIYFLNNVYIQTDYDPTNPESSIPNDTTFYNGYYFIQHKGEERFKKKTIAGAVFFKKQDLFFQDDLDYTYTRLSDLGVFRFTDIRYDNAGRDSSNTRNLLNARIQLTPRKSQGFTIESEVTHSGGNIGIAGSFGYQNRNTFRGAELFEAKIHASVESVQNFSDTTENTRLFFFNTYEIGPEIKLTLKKFLLPRFLTDKASRYFNPRTTLSGSYIFQSRPDYKRSILNFAFGWNWRGSATQRWMVFPVEISSIDVALSPAFSDFLNQSSHNLAFLYSYQPHLITSGRFVWLYSNQGKRKDKNFLFVKGNFETAGASLWLLNRINAFPSKKDEDGNYTALGLTFSQYIKPEIDVSYHDWINENSSLVYRITGGVGFSYGNSKGKILPFEKAFYSGGANSIRAWTARTLGPGSYKDTSDVLYIERIGDVKMEASVEYRSVIFKYLEGAVFWDMGNIWLRKDPSGTLTGSSFQWNHILDDFAIGAGIGARLNFDFFILRFDGAVKLRDPQLPDGREWVYGYKPFDIGDITLNFAIGYPF